MCEIGRDKSRPYIVRVVNVGDVDAHLGSLFDAGYDFKGAAEVFDVMAQCGKWGINRV